MITVTFDSLKDGSSEIDYVDDELAFLYDMRRLPAIARESIIKVDMVVGLICVEGKMQFSIGEKICTLKPNQIAIVTHGTIVKDIMYTPDFLGNALGISDFAIGKREIDDRRIWQFINYIKDVSVITMTDKEVFMVNSINQMVKECILDKGKYKREQMIKLLEHFCALEFMGIFNRVVPDDEPSDELACDEITNRFTAELMKANGKIHTVAEIADRLNVTPKYLSTTISQKTGKSALKWIHEALIKETVHRLKYTTDSLKVISEDLNFSGVSFFGKFVKKMTGMTPIEIRNGK